jgi:ketosteroid isomerase-like protein
MLPDGSAYANSYHFLLAFDGGLLIEIREYLDTAPVAAIRRLLATKPDHRSGGPGSAAG